MFDPRFALSTMLPLAEAAYDLSLLPKDWKLIAPIQPDNFGFVASRNGVTIVSFRGTQTKGEWLEDFDGLAVPNEFGKGMVHQGFQDQYAKLRPSLLAAIAGAPGVLWITGHSLGGALATLCASDTVLIARNPLVYTWAGPRVGWHDYAGWFKPSQFYRIVNEWDAVPNEPPAINFYEHVGEEIRIDGGRPAINKDFLKVAHNLELSYRVGVQKLIPPPIPAVQKAA
jgi:predicted lipase